MIFGIDHGFDCIYETFCRSAVLLRNNHQNENKRRAWKEKNVEKKENEHNLCISASPAGEILTGNIKIRTETHTHKIFDPNVCC